MLRLIVLAALFNIVLSAYFRKDVLKCELLFHPLMSKRTRKHVCQSEINTDSRFRHFVQIGNDLIPGRLHCCMDMRNTEPVPPVTPKIDLSECFKIPQRADSCKVDICIGRKKGYVVSKDGTIDTDLLKRVIMEDEGLPQDIKTKVIDSCVNGDLSLFGEPSFCDPIKLRNCMMVQFMSGCTKWHNEGQCGKSEQLVKECIVPTIHDLKN